MPDRDRQGPDRQTTAARPDLVRALRETLSSYGYSEYADTDFPGLGRASLIMTPRRWMVRLVCAVVDAPGDAPIALDGKQMLASIRRFLTRKYARFPYWKELGTFLVLLCPRVLYETLVGRVSEFHDRTGLHTNVMLGIVLVDRERYMIAGASACGLFKTGEHFGAIHLAVRQWCQARRAAP